MCDEAKLKDWARGVVSRRDLGVLAGSAAVLSACDSAGIVSSAQALEGAISERQVSFETADGTMDGFFVHPATGKHPGVLLWPDIASIRESKRNMARRLAGEGYAVLILNPYYRDVAGEQFADFAAFIEAEGFQKVRPWRGQLSSFAVKRDAEAAVAWLDAQDAVDTSRGIGAQGYCMGGPFTVYSTSAVPDRVKAAASFHGGGLVREDEESPHILLANTQAGYLFAIAQDDDAQSPGDKGALTEATQAAGRPAKVEVYPGDHGWTVPDSPAYAEAAAEQAYADLLELYSANL